MVVQLQAPLLLEDEELERPSASPVDMGVTSLCGVDFFGRSKACGSWGHDGTRGASGGDPRDKAWMGPACYIIPYDAVHSFWGVVVSYILDHHGMECGTSART